MPEEGKCRHLNKTTTKTNPKGTRIQAHGRVSNDAYAMTGQEELGKWGTDDEGVLPLH